MENASAIFLPPATAKGHIWKMVTGITELNLQTEGKIVTLLKGKEPNPSLQFSVIKGTNKPISHQLVTTDDRM